MAGCSCCHYGPSAIYIALSALPVRGFRSAKSLPTSLLAHPHECPDNHREAPYNNRRQDDTCINDRLPQALLELILSRLHQRGDISSALLTCKQWHAVAVGLRGKLVYRSGPTSCLHAMLCCSERVQEVSLNLECVPGGEGLVDDLLLKVASLQQATTLKVLNCSDVLQLPPSSLASVQKLHVGGTLQFHVQSLVLAAGSAIVELDLDVVDPFNSHKFAAVLRSTAVNLKRLTIRHALVTSNSDGWEELHGSRLEIAEKGPELESLWLEGCPSWETVGPLLQLADASTALTSLGLVRCAVWREMLLELAPKWRGLTRLHLAKCRGMNDSVFCSLVEVAGAQLQDLTLEGDGFSDGALFGIAEHCISLRSLALHNSQGLGASGLLAVAKGCQGLEALHLEQCPGLSGEGLAGVCAEVAALRSLTVLHCSQIWDVDWLGIVISDCGWSLERLRVEGLADHNFLVIEEGMCPRLKELHIGTDHHCWLATRGLAVCIAPDLATPVTSLSLPFAGLPLSILRLQGCRGMRDDQLAVIAVACQRLKLLDISGCSNLTDRGVASIARSCCALEEFIAHRCHKLGDKGLIELAKERRLSLKRLELGECKQVSDRGLVAFATVGARVEKLVLCALSGVTDWALWMLARGCGRLEHVEVYGCMGVAEKGVMSLVEGCKLLGSLRLGEELMSDEVRRRARAAGVLLKVV